MESEFLKMDLFFIIASIFCVVIGVLISLILWKVLKLLNEVEKAKESIEKFVKKWRSKLKFNKK